jgi:hypothetical protein
MTFGAMTAVWLILTQWIASGLGGYLTGRLRARWIAGAGASAAAADPDAARRVGSALSIVTALSMLVGAFIASVAAALGSHERGLHP